MIKRDYYFINFSIMKRNKGFTLIELLVVIAIIGIISTAIFAFLNDAKTRSSDASVKATLNQARTQADLFFSNDGIYTGVCSVASDSLTPKGINFMIYSAGKSGGYLNPVTVNGSGSSPVRCNEAATGWAAEVPLKNTTGYYCVDYTRKGIVTSVSIGDSYAYCQ
jgi:prepilin-type N-terminal cleavage/methylation domain-containing protein